MRFFVVTERTMRELLEGIFPPQLIRAASPDSIERALETMSAPDILASLWRQSSGIGDFLDDEELCLLSPQNAVYVWEEQLLFVEKEGPFDDEHVHGKCHWKVFDARWFPFATRNGGENIYCLDGYPSQEGRLHQVIDVHHIEGLHGCEAPSLQDFFEIEARRRRAEST